MDKTNELTVYNTRNNREYDIILIAPYSAGCIDLSHLESLPLKIAIYSQNRLMSMLTRIEESEIQKIEDLTVKTRILMNLETKSIDYIMKVIDGCISTQTDYIDDCCDISILKSIFLLYNEKARSSKTKIIQGCVLEAFLVDIGVRILEEAYEVGSVKLNCVRCNSNEILYQNIQSRIASMQHFIEFTANQSRYLLRKGKNKTSGFEIVFENEQFNNVFEQFVRYVVGMLWIGSNIPKINSTDIENKIVLKGILPKVDRSVRMIITLNNPIKSSDLFCMSEVGLAIFEIDNSSSGVLTATVATKKSKIIDRLITKGIKFDCQTVK